MISSVIFILMLAWTVLTNAKDLPASKTNLIIAMIIALLIEIYCYIVIDSLCQKLQETSQPTPPFILHLPN